MRFKRTNVAVLNGRGVRRCWGVWDRDDNFMGTLAWLFIIGPEHFYIFFPTGSTLGGYRFSANSNDEAITIIGQALS